MTINKAEARKTIESLNAVGSPVERGVRPLRPYMCYCGDAADGAVLAWAHTAQDAAAELAALRKDAERWRHCKAHGHPMTGPQCIAWTFDGRMVFGATPEEAVDNAMAYRVPAVGAANS